MDDKLKVLMQDLGNAINETLSDSDRIAAAIGEIRHAGYDVFLVLEATIGFNKREEAAEGAEPTEETELSELEDRPIRAGGRDFDSQAKVKWTSQDQKFLRALKIAVDDDGR